MKANAMADKAMKAKAMKAKAMKAEADPAKSGAGLPVPVDPVGSAKAGTQVAGRQLAPERTHGNEPDLPVEKPGVGIASLLVQSSPPFAKVFLDGRAMGVTPIRLPDMVAGPHRLLIQGPNGVPMDTLLDVPPERLTLKVQLDPGAIAFETEE